jgi:hypothetical protein
MDSPFFSIPRWFCRKEATDASMSKEIKSPKLAATGVPMLSGSTLIKLNNARKALVVCTGNYPPNNMLRFIKLTDK